MTLAFAKLFTKYPIKTRRALEIVPGFFSWALITFPVWGSITFPAVVAYFILFFDVYWFYKSFSLVVSAYIALKRIRAAEKTDWLSKAEKLENFEKTTHVVIIPNYNESVEKIRKTLHVLTYQTLPLKKIHIVLAMEERAVDSKEKASILIKEFGDRFGSVLASFHPRIPGEVVGKSSNEAFGGKFAYSKLVETGLIDINYATISSVDADSLFDKNYFSYLTYSFLRDPKRYSKFWQSANVHYNNFWDVPAPIRVMSFFNSLHRAALLVQPDRLVSNSTYSLTFKMLHEIGYWDTDVVPEDYRIFFKAFFVLKGNAWVEPIFLKTSMDAAQSSTYIKSLKNRYNQEMRWSWGVSDDPLFIKWWLTVPGVPFFRKTWLLFNVLLDHFLWPVNWFIITVAANIMPFVNPIFTRTSLGNTLPDIARTILTTTLFAILCMIIIDYRMRPRESHVSKTRQFLFPLEFFLLPIVGFFLATVPAMISHTKLMFGKRMEYKVTEKV